MPEKIKDTLSERQAATDLANAAFAANRAKETHLLLSGLSPEMQGAILADLLARWLAGFPNYHRARMLRLHLRLIRPLIAINERGLFGNGGHPGNRRRP